MKLLKEEFEKLLLEVGCDFNEKELTALFPMQGNMYNQELMIVGRSTNGWGEHDNDMRWKPFKSKPNIGYIIECSQEGDNPGECPLKWIIDHWHSYSPGNIGGRHDYSIIRSAFWRITKEILNTFNTLEKINIPNFEEKWSSYLVWTNLYLINKPTKGGGNPSEKLCNAQFDNCVSMLMKEIEYFKPKKILFLTGYDWFKEFQTKISKFETKKKLVGLAEWSGYYGKTMIVVAKHPQGKKEKKYVDQVVTAFGNL